MTQFVFWLANHSLLGQRSLEDVIMIVGNQLRALGHTAVWDPANNQLVTADSGINVVVEGFTPASVAVMAEYHGKGARFLILATEEPTPTGFNHGTQREMVGRQEIFPEAAKYAEGIIHLVPGDHVTNWYAQFAPSAYTELGYAPKLVRIMNNLEPPFDFGFYGSLTPRRRDILKKLAKIAGTPRAVRVMNDFKTQMERDVAMRDAKVIVQLRKFEPMGLVSSSRCNTALCLGRPIVAEPHELSAPWDRIVRFSATSESFFAEAMMARSSWRGMHAHQFDRFKAELPPEKCIGAALAKIGIIERMAA